MKNSIEEIREQYPVRSTWHNKYDDGFICEVTGHYVNSDGEMIVEYKYRKFGFTIPGAVSTEHFKSFWRKEKQQAKKIQIKKIIASVVLALISVGCKSFRQDFGMEKRDPQPLYGVIGPMNQMFSGTGTAPLQVTETASWPVDHIEVYWAPKYSHAENGNIVNTCEAFSNKTVPGVGHANIVDLTNVDFLVVDKTVTVNFRTASGEGCYAVKTFPVK